MAAWVQRNSGWFVLAALILTVLSYFTGWTRGDAALTTRVEALETWRPTHEEAQRAAFKDLSDGQIRMTETQARMERSLGRIEGAVGVKPGP